MNVSCGTMEGDMVEAGTQVLIERVMCVAVLVLCLVGLGWDLVEWVREKWISRRLK